MRAAEARARLLRARVGFRVAVAEVWSEREGRPLERGTKARVEEEGLRVLRSDARRPPVERRLRAGSARPARWSRRSFRPAAAAAVGLAATAAAAGLGWGEGAVSLAATLSAAGAAWAFWRGRR